MLGGLIEPAPGEGQATDQFLGQDLVDPQRADLVGPPDRALALVPASQPVERVGLAGEHVGAEEPHQAEPLGRGDRNIGQLDRLLEPARGIDQPDHVGVGPPDIVDDVEILGDRQRGAEILEPLVHLAADAPAEAARIERMSFDIAGSDEMRDGEGFLQRNGALTNSIRQSRPLNMFHHEVVRPDIEQCADVGMIQRRDGSRLLLKALGEVALTDLDRDEPIQPRVASLPHLSHPTGAKMRQDFVRPEFVPGG